MCLPAKTKSDKLRISTQFHVAFAPDFYVQTSFLLPWHETTADFPLHFHGIKDNGQILRAGIRDAE